MSMRPWTCERCGRPCNYLGLQLLAGQDAGATYGVGWGCSACDYKALDVCLDEKSQIQALDRTQPGLPMKKGRAGTMTHDDKRNGTTTLFEALNMLTAG